MQLDQDLLNLWLLARNGLSCETARRLIEAVQEARSNGAYPRGHNISDRGSLLWAVDSQEASFNKEPEGLYRYVKHEQIEEMEKSGWVTAADLLGTNSGEYAVAMKFMGQDYCKRGKN